MGECLLRCQAFVSVNLGGLRLNIGVKFWIYDLQGLLYLTFKVSV